MPRLQEEQGPGGAIQPCCDLVLHDAEDWEAAADGGSSKKAVDTLLRLARRLRVPVQNRNFAIEVGAGAVHRAQVPDGLQGRLVVGRGKKAAMVEPCCAVVG